MPLLTLLLALLAGLLAAYVLQRRQRSPPPATGLLGLYYFYQADYQQALAGFGQAQQPAWNALLVADYLTQTRWQLSIGGELPYSFSDN